MSEVSKRRDETIDKAAEFRAKFEEQLRVAREYEKLLSQLRVWLEEASALSGITQQPLPIGPQDNEHESSPGTDRINLPTLRQMIIEAVLQMPSDFNLNAVSDKVREIYHVVPKRNSLAVILFDLVRADRLVRVSPGKYSKLEQPGELVSTDQRGGDLRSIPA